MLSITSNWRLLPNNVDDTLSIVTTEFLRPSSWGAGPDSSPLRSLIRLICRHKHQDSFDTRELSLWRSSLAKVKLTNFIFGQSHNFAISSSKYTIDSHKTSSSLELNATLIFSLLSHIVSPLAILVITFHYFSILELVNVISEWLDWLCESWIKMTIKLFRLVMLLRQTIWIQAIRNHFVNVNLLFYQCESVILLEISFQVFMMIQTGQVTWNKQLFSSYLKLFC